MSSEATENDDSNSSDKTFINKLLVEMKTQFNSTDVKKENPSSDASPETKVPDDLSAENTVESDCPQAADVVTEECVKEEVVENIPEVKEVLNSDTPSEETESTENKDEICAQEEAEQDKPRIVLTFRKPATTAKNKSKMNEEVNLTRRSLRNKTAEERSEETVLKRSARRRSKDCNESVLQSAIARKEKSYNESNKPQRLTRQLKPTQKILDNIAYATLKYEKNRNEKNKTNKDKQKNSNDADNNVDGSSKSDESAVTSGSEDILDVENVQKRHKHKRHQNKHAKNNSKRLKTSEDLKNEDSDESSSLDLSDSGKKPDPCLAPSRRSQRISLSNRLKDDDMEDTEESILEPSTAEQNSVYPADPECSSVGAQLIASRLCLCTQKTNLYVSPQNNEELYCSAIDYVNEKLVGCNRIIDDSDLSMIRPSHRVPFGSFCTVHYNRMLRHNCCPTCGIFCTQGKFTECEAKHQYHRECQISVGDVECCPHCGLSTPSYDVYITMQSSKKPVILPTRKFSRPAAKMNFKSSDKLKLDMSDSEPILLKDLLQFPLSVVSDNKMYSASDLLEAIKGENIEKLSIILGSSGVPVNLTFPEIDGGTVLHYASQNGLLQVVHMLTVSGAELDVLDKEQNTPLIQAILAFKNIVVRYLIKAGASITLKGTDGMTALHLAAKCGNLEACQLLVTASLYHRDYVDTGDDGGWTPLVWACEHGHTDIAKYLLNRGADPHIRDVEHNVALHWAAFSDSGDITEILLNSGCEINAVNVHGESPLHIGARQDNYNSVLILLARGADVTLINKLGESPLDCASSVGNCYNAIALNVHFLSASTSDANRKTLLTNDISRGRETNPIQCVNAVDDDSQPSDFVYVSKSCETSEIHIDRKIGTLQSCNCEDKCLTSGCDCGNNSLKCWYDEDGKLSLDFDYTDPPMIFECNVACGCNAITCGNRVVQHGLTQRFQLFKTENKGWGLRTLRNIPKGSFVCEYVGEIISDAEAEQRDDDCYIFDLNNRTSLGTDECNSYCIDARHYGNFSRFINHSCEPNLFSVKVFVEHQDLRFPRIAFFATRDVCANEELSFDYGEKFWLVKYKSFTCDCGSNTCRYSEEGILAILEQENGNVHINCS